MKKNILKHISVIISFIIIIGFAGITLTNYYTYKKVIRDDIENISKLTSSNIYCTIKTEFSKPVYVSLTMANNTLLKSWLHEEEKMRDNPNHLQKLQIYRTRKPTTERSSPFRGGMKVRSDTECHINRRFVVL